ncbi:unnamed protein product [Clonostachys rosea]|uniref:Uncharacterized protein n=1 Tax=Bionectria ochroleuca TaxID=29856 RepID=A0ABY6UZV5_BIOOC|nr:unnamed protein product [Clonostachys rosea]
MAVVHVSENVVAALAVDLRDVESSTSERRSNTVPKSLLGQDCIDSIPQKEEKENKGMGKAISCYSTVYKLWLTISYNSIVRSSSSLPTAEQLSIDRTFDKKHIEKSTPLNTNLVLPRDIEARSNESNAKNMF